MNQKQSWESEFDEKEKLSFARGGFLVTDYPGENGVNHWCLDPISVRQFIQEKIQQAISTREKEISEEVKNLKNITDRFSHIVPTVALEEVLSIINNK